MMLSTQTDTSGAVREKPSGRSGARADRLLVRDVSRIGSVGSALCLGCQRVSCFLWCTGRHPGITRFPRTARDSLTPPVVARAARDARNLGVWPAARQRNNAVA